MTLEESKADCTVSSIWVCMIGNKFLTVNGLTAWENEKGIEELFKSSDYWKELSKETANDEELYNKLLSERSVRYFEIKPE